MTLRSSGGAGRGLMLIAVICTITAAAAAVLGWDRHVTLKTRDRLYSSVEELPPRKVGLVLGTAKYRPGGEENRYYRYRIDAAEKVFRAGRVEYLLVSGDNRHDSYNEPEQMRQDLLARGVPDERIYLDYAGFRTLDSIVRCREVFQERRITVISQPFHNQRALFIASRRGVDAIGFNAQDVGGEAGLKVQMREKLARVKMALDLLINKQPHFLGDTIPIE